MTLSNQQESFQIHPKDDYEANIFQLDEADENVAPIKLGRILIAEDSSFDFRYLVSCLKATGLTTPITWVEDGAELLSFMEGKNTYEDSDCAQEDISLIILDLKMPKVDGLSALKGLRQHPAPRIQQVPVIVLTTSIFEDDLRQASELGITDYIVKPETQKETSRMIDDMKVILKRLADAD